MYTKKETDTLLRSISYISSGYNIFSEVFDDITYNDEMLCEKLKLRDLDFRDVCKDVCKNRMDQELLIYKMIKKIVKNRHNKFLRNNLIDYLQIE